VIAKGIITLWLYYIMSMNLIFIFSTNITAIIDNKRAFTLEGGLY